MNTAQRREAAQYLLKAIAAAANDGNTPAAEALMALYEVLKQPVPPCELPEIVRKSMSQSATEPDSNVLVRAALEKDAVSVAAAMEHAGASVFAIAPSTERPGEYLIFARYDPRKTSVDEIDRWIDVTDLPVVDEPDAKPTVEDLPSVENPAREVTFRDQHVAGLLELITAVLKDSKTTTNLKVSWIHRDGADYDVRLTLKSALASEADRLADCIQDYFSVADY